MCDSRTLAPSLFRPGINMHFNRSSHKWTALRTGVNTSKTHSVRLHAQLSQITAIVRLCCSIRQLQLSEYTCRWENWITSRCMSYPGTLGGAVPISTNGNRVTSGWPLYITSCLGIWERWRTRSKGKLHLCTFRIWCAWSLHKLDAQWRSCLRWLRRKAAAAAATADATAAAATATATATAATILLLPAHSPSKKKKSQACAECKNPIRSDGAYTCRSNATINRII